MIKLQYLFGLTDAELTDYNIAMNNPVADENGIMQNPLDYYIKDEQKLLQYTGWYKSKPTSDRPNPRVFRTLDREKTLQFVQYTNRETWLFVGEFKHDAFKPTADGRGYAYPQTLNDEFSQYAGRLVVHYKKHSGDTQARIRPENWMQDFSVVEILPSKYTGAKFPGYYNIKIPYSELSTVVNNENQDWHTALANVKGVYVITDRKTGKLYVGSAYGQEMIWSRWAEYIKTGHGGDVELRKIPFDYIQKYFQYSLLEIFEPNISDQIVLDRESFWKEVLDSRKHGYNGN